MQWFDSGSRESTQNILLPMRISRSFSHCTPSVTWGNERQNFRTDSMSISSADRRSTDFSLCMPLISIAEVEDEIISHLTFLICHWRIQLWSKTNMREP